MEHHGKIEKHKFAIIGTSSAGKTTLTFEIIGKLKKLGVLVDGVVQQDRRIAFDRAFLETEKEAQYWVIFNQLIKECELLLKHGTDTIVSDRSVIDFYAYYETMYGRNKVLFDFLKYWATTYDVLFYLNPLPYHNDGARPPEEFVERVDNTLKRIIKEIPNVMCIDREEVYGEILKRINRVLTPYELSLIPQVLERDVLIGGSYAFNRQTRFSDIDIYVLGDEYINQLPELEKRLRDLFGANFQVRQVKGPAWDYLRREGFIHIDAEGASHENNFC